MKQLKSIIPLSLALVVLVSYQFIGAAWTNAPANPPTGNAETPLHTGGAQSKTGALTTGNQGIISGAPTQQFVDSNERDWWIHVNGNRMYFLVDRSSPENGTWDTPHPLYLDLNGAHFGGHIYSAGNMHASNIVKSNTQMRSPSYCDQDGNNCMVPSTNKIPMCAAGKILKSNGTSWQCGDDDGGTSVSCTNRTYTKMTCQSNSKTCAPGWEISRKQATMVGCPDDGAAWELTCGICD